MNSIRSITEGAILTALYSIFLLAVLFLPIFGPFFIFVLPIPFIIYVMRHSLKKGLFLLIVALWITYMVGSILAVPMTFMFGTIGLVMGYMYSLKKSAFLIFILGSLSYIANFLIMFLITNVFFHINIIDDTKNMMYQSMKDAEKIVTSLGQSTDQFVVMYEYIESISYIVPSLIVIVSVIFAFITQFFSNRILKRFTAEVNVFPPIREWSFPKSLLWYYLIVMILAMFDFEQGSMMFSIIINLLIVLEIVMTIQGFSVLFHYFHVNNKSKAIPVGLVIVSFILPFLLVIIRILGIIDLGFDLRKRMEKPQ